MARGGYGCWIICSTELADGELADGELADGELADGGLADGAGLTCAVGAG